MRKNLLLNGDKFYKANLNSKTSLSSGKLTAKQLKDAYKAKGYSIIAFCDEKPSLYSELSENDFLILTAYRTKIENYNFILYSKNENSIDLVEYNSDISKSKEENINEFIKKASEKGFLVCLEHPCKSMLSYSEIKNIEGLFGIEIANYSSFKEGHLEDNNHIYDRLLRRTIQFPLPIASDGNKNQADFESADNDSFGAYTYINSKDLSYLSVIKALQNGDYYISTGPVFKEIYAENSKLYIKCSPVRSIRMLNEGRDAPVAIAKDGELITEAVFDIDPAFCGRIIRVDIRDENGNFADTVPYLIKELWGG